MLDSSAILPVLLLLLLAFGTLRRLPMLDLFLAGAKRGLHVAVEVLPNLAAMMCAISLMRASGLMDALCTACAPVMQFLGLPAQVAPLAFLRPISGSASLALLEELLKTFGPDSRVGLVASVIMGSSETVFYTVCVYLSGLQQRKTGYAVPCALAGALASMWLAGMLFGR